MTIDEFNAILAEARARGMVKAAYLGEHKYYSLVDKASVSQLERRNGVTRYLGLPIYRVAGDKQHCFIAVECDLDHPSA